MKQVYKCAIVILVFIAAGSQCIKAQVQTAYLVADSTYLRLIDGTHINWSNVSDSSITLFEFGDTVMSKLRVELVTSPASESEIYMALASDADSSYLVLEGTTLKNRLGEVLANGIHAGQILNIVRCGPERTYLLDSLVIYSDTLPDSASVRGNIWFEQAAGEQLYVEMDTASDQDCIFPINMLPGLESASYTDGQDIYLRWAPPTHEEWATINEQDLEYRIDRLTLKDANGDFLDAASREASRVTIDNIVPFTQQEWISNFDPGNACAQVASGTLYEVDTSLSSPSSDPTLSDALDFQVSQEARYAFALLAADQDFEVAAGLALAYLDSTAQSNVEYLYKIRVNTTDPRLLHLYAFQRVSLDSATTMPTPSIDTIIGGDHTAELTWNILNNEDTYSTYDIERSTDGTNFITVNEMPFIYIATDEDIAETATYIDSLDDNTTVYQYRIRGRNSFGMLGPPSSTIQAQGVPPRLDLSLRIDTAYSSEVESMIQWSVDPESVEPALVSFDIYRSESHNEGFEKINAGPISSLVETYTDAQAVPAGYYYVECLDNNGHRYRSVPKLVQLIDSTPPPIPTGLSGEFQSSRQVQLTWSQVADPSLLGYKVFAANMPDGTYVQLTSEVLSDTFFIHEVNPEFIVDSIYFKVLASDVRHNDSEESEYLAIKRPDIIPPSAPTLHKASPTPTGVEMSWQLSSSPDVAYHELQRKAAHLPSWALIETIDSAFNASLLQNVDSSGITSTMYVDTQATVMQTYSYRLLAFDESGNFSSSKVLKVRPYFNKEHEDIENFSVLLECIPDPGIETDSVYEVIDWLLVQFEQTDSIQFDTLALLSFHNVISMAEYNDLMQLSDAEIYTFLTELKVSYFNEQLQTKVTVSWQLPNDEMLRDVQIYRSVNGSGLMLYKTLVPEMVPDETYEDNDVKPGHHYLYQMMANYDDGGYSPLTDTKLIRVPSSL